MRQVQPEFSEENLGVMRYVDHQELRYSLRSVEAKTQLDEVAS